MLKTILYIEQQTKQFEIGNRPIFFRVSTQSLLKIEKIGNSLYAILVDRTCNREGPSHRVEQNIPLEITSTNGFICFNKAIIQGWQTSIIKDQIISIISNDNKISISGSDNMPQVNADGEQDGNSILLIPSTIRIMHHSISPIDPRLTNSGFIDNKRTIFISKRSFSYDFKPALLKLSPNRNCLVINLEDLISAQESITKLFRINEFNNIVNFRSPLELFEALATGEIKLSADDLIVTDNHMPGFRGSDLIIAIRTGLIPYEVQGYF